MTTNHQQALVVLRDRRRTPRSRIVLLDEQGLVDRAVWARWLARVLRRIAAMRPDLADHIVPQLEDLDRGQWPARVKTTQRALASGSDDVEAERAVMVVGYEEAYHAHRACAARCPSLSRDPDDAYWWAAEQQVDDLVEILEAVERAKVSDVGGGGSPAPLITRERIRAWVADGRIMERIPEAGLPLADVLRLDIPAADRVRIATRSGALPEPTLCRWLGIVLRRLIGRVAAPDLRSVAVLDALDRGEWPDEKTRRGAADAAATVDTDAAWVAATFAAYRAYRAARGGKGVYAAYAAAAAYAAYAAAAAAAADADATVYAAAYAAAAAAATVYAAAYAAAAAAAERSQQVADLLALIGGAR